VDVPDRSTLHSLPSPVPPPSFGENNKVKQSYKYNKQKQRLFTYPFRITDVNSDTVVIDRTSKDEPTDKCPHVSISSDNGSLTP
jgi:hypothetical protein